jgi:coenzyme F420-reducing hydrogenase delta subunit
VDYAKVLLDEVGLGGDRLEMYHVGASDAPVWVEKVVEMTERIRALGPNPLKEEKTREDSAGPGIF